MRQVIRSGVVLLGALVGVACGSGSTREVNETVADDAPTEATDDASAEVPDAMDADEESGATTNGPPSETERSDRDETDRDEDVMPPAATDAPQPLETNDGGVEPPSDCLDTECEEVNPETPPDAEYAPCAGKVCGETCRVCAPGDSNCQEDPDIKLCDSAGRCESLSVNCEPPLEVALFDCVIPEELSDPVCAPAEFQSTDADCVEQSWAWNGCECTPVTHCGCASGDCDRLFPDYASCKAVQAACWPNACQAEDAVSDGTMCGSTYGYAFTGHGCEEIICGCRGADCLGTADTLEECEARWSTCLDRVPECSARRFPVVNTDQVFEPAYPEFGFSVQGYDDLYDPATGTVAVFADWTAAQWVGWEDPSGEPDNSCPSIRTLPMSFACPRPRPLVLLVGEETYRVNVTLLWGLNIWSLAEPPNVSLRISPHPTGTLMLEIRDDATGLPVIVIVQSEPEIAAREDAWESQPFTIAPDTTHCRTDPGECNWSFAALDLKVSTSATEWTIEPLSFQRLETPEANYTLVNGYVFRQAFAADTTCSQHYPPRQNFVLMQAHPPR